MCVCFYSCNTSFDRHFFRFEEVKSNGIYVEKRSDRNGIPDHQLFSHLTQLLLRPPLLPFFRVLLRTLGFLTNPTSVRKTPGTIIQISSLRFSSKPDERRRSTCDAWHNTRGLPRGLACQLTSPKQRGPDYKPTITDQSCEQQSEARKTGRKISKKLTAAENIKDLKKKNK